MPSSSMRKSLGKAHCRHLPKRLRFLRPHAHSSRRESREVGQVAIAISKERIGDAFNSATVLGSVKPCKMNFRSIARSSDDQSVSLFKVSQCFLKGMQLRRTDKSKVLWVPKEQNFLFLADGLFQNVRESISHFIHCINGKVGNFFQRWSL